jgi:hypothetical protein
MCAERGYIVNQIKIEILNLLHSYMFKRDKCLSHTILEIVQLVIEVLNVNYGLFLFFINIDTEEVTISIRHKINKVPWNFVCLINVQESTS